MTHSHRDAPGGHIFSDIEFEGSTAWTQRGRKAIKKITAHAMRRESKRIKAAALLEYQVDLIESRHELLDDFDEYYPFHEFQQDAIDYIRSEEYMELCESQPDWEDYSWYGLSDYSHAEPTECQDTVARIHNILSPDAIHMAFHDAERLVHDDMTLKQFLDLIEELAAKHDDRIWSKVA